MEYCQLPWCDELYKQEGPDSLRPFDKSCWFDVKDSMGMTFPGLPYLVDGDNKLSQSQAILRYVARKRPELNLLGQDTGNVDTGCNAVDQVR
jgi:glutathione S-transferase